MRRHTLRIAYVALVTLLVACGGGAVQPTSVRVADELATATIFSAPRLATTTNTQATSTPRRPNPSVTPRRATPTVMVAVSTATTAPDPTATATPEPCPGAIAWDEAPAHAGQIVTVRGPVVDATFASASRGQPTFLNLGKGYPDPGRFTVVIWIPNRDNFPAPPEELYRDKIVCVTGQVTLYNGSAEMEIIGPEDIDIQPS